MGGIAMSRKSAQEQFCFPFDLLTALIFHLLHCNVAV